MGTETSNSGVDKYTRSANSVKLNNPLMGTETIKFKKNFRGFSVLGVKLNNPLMGTETEITTKNTTVQATTEKLN